jgi:hypothetical protein
MWQSQTDQRGLCNAGHALCMLDEEGCRQTLRICNSWCFCSATMVTRTRLNFMLVRKINNFKSLSCRMWRCGMELLQMCLRKMLRFSLTCNACCYMPGERLLIFTSVKNLEAHISFVLQTDRWTEKEYYVDTEQQNTQIIPRPEGLHSVFNSICRLLLEHTHTHIVYTRKPPESKKHEKLPRTKARQLLTDITLRFTHKIWCRNGQCCP